MKNDGFQFKQFFVKHDRCAQKVGTDGVLLGAWCRLPEEGKVLDIGSGCGLISLMIAQRGPGLLVDAVEIDKQAAEQGRENFQHSQWNERLTQYCDDIKDYTLTCDSQYEVIVSNPPFFNGSLRSQDVLRTQARHTVHLSFEDLFACVRKLLSPNGTFALILPTDLHDTIVSISTRYGLYMSASLNVLPTPSSASKRGLYEFKKSVQESPLSDSLVIEHDRHCYSEEYIRLTKDFYLLM